MNEGKPTKSTRPRWWSRPRPTPPGQQEEFTATVRPAADGDYVLERPARSTDAEATAAEATVATAGGVAPEEAIPGGAMAEGGSELTPPAAADDGRGGDGTSGAPAPGPALPAASGPALPAASGPALPAASGAALPAVSGERSEPLHDPDPYRTPPYGRPGPWAPAPPVQHPAAASPAPGPAIDASVPPQGSPPEAAAAPHGTTTPTGAPSDGSAPAVDVPSPPTGDPWQRYDPWAAAQLHASPLQQTGAKVLSEQQKRRRAWRILVGGAVVIALVAGGIGGVVGAYLERNGVGTIELPQAGKEPAGRAPDSVAGIAARALPSVVTLHVTGPGEKGTGTGFVLDRLGHILTNNHVVEPAASGGDISVTFSGGQTAHGTVVGRDTGYDLAVVQVHGVRGLTPMPLGNSDNVQVGDPVVAIGAPFDLANTVTSGIISAKERPITAGGEKGDGSDLSYVDALQTDAPINPGNSGGPLLDSHGRVVGINSAIRSADSGADPETGQAGSIGLGFAIPVNQAKRVAEELINTGRASHPVIGVTLDMNYAGDGARVGTKGADGGSPVTPGGPGAKAGIRAGDVITTLDGQAVHSGEELIVRTRAHRPGDRLRLTVERGGKKLKISLVLGSSNSD